MDGWLEQPIDRGHDREAFDCGVPVLNDYLIRYARQNHVSGVAKTFVAVVAGKENEILGYYSMAPGEIEVGRVPPFLVKGRGRYALPVYRLARLAVARSHRRRGVGTELLAAAGLRALAASAEIGGIALAVDAKDAEAARWYMRFGALPLLDNPLNVVIPLAALTLGVQAVRKSWQDD